MLSNYQRVDILKCKHFIMYKETTIPLKKIDWYTISITLYGEAYYCRSSIIYIYKLLQGMMFSWESYLYVSKKLAWTNNTLFIDHIIPMYQRRVEQMFRFLTLKFLRGTTWASRHYSVVLEVSCCLILRENGLDSNVNQIMDEKTMMQPLMWIMMLPRCWNYTR